jgi:hypothetical protein
MTIDEFWQLAYLAALLQSGCNDTARTQADTAIDDLANRWHRGGDEE